MPAQDNTRPCTSRRAQQAARPTARRKLEMELLSDTGSENSPQVRQLHMQVVSLDAERVQPCELKQFSWTCRLLRTSSLTMTTMRMRTSQASLLEAHIANARPQKFRRKLLCHFSSFACGSMHVAFLCTALKVTVNLSGQGRAGQGRAGQGRAGQGRAGQGRAGQGRAGQLTMARACAFVFVVDDSVCIWMQGQEANPT